MTAIEGRKGVSLQMKAAHQHGVFAIPLHDAFAAWFHGAVVAVWLFEHLVVALIQADQVAVLNGKAQLRIKRGSGEAFRIAEDVIPELDGAGGLLFSADHAQPIGMLGINGIGLFEQDRPWMELYERAIPQKDVGIQGWVVEGLLLIAVFAAEQVEKTPNVWGDHSALMGPKKNNKKSPPRGAWKTTSTNQIRALMA